MSLLSYTTPTATYFAELLVVMACIQQEVERLLMAQHRRPSKRGIPARTWVGIAHVSALYEPSDEGEIILW